MRKLSILAFALVLTMSLLAGCRYGNNNGATGATNLPSTQATTPMQPSTQATMPSTQTTTPSTHASEPSMESSLPGATESTHINEGGENATGNTENENARTRGRTGPRY